MKTEVSKTWLLDKVRTNKATHRDIFIKAQEGYRKAAIKTFEENLKAARDGKPFRAYVNLTQPMDQTKEYDRTIGMIENATTDTIELNEEDYAHFVQDDWDWKNQFVASTAAYLTTEE